MAVVWDTVSENNFSTYVMIGKNRPSIKTASRCVIAWLSPNFLLPHWRSHSLRHKKCSLPAFSHDFDAVDGIHDHSPSPTWSLFSFKAKSEPFTLTTWNLTQPFSSSESSCNLISLNNLQIS